MKRFYIISLILITVSCSSSGNLTIDQIAGKYERIVDDWYNMKENVFYSTMVLNTDGTFVYSWESIAFKGGITTGKWELEGERVLFNSDLQSSTIESDYEVIRVDFKDADSITVKLKDTANLPVPFATCILKSDTILAGKMSDINGKLMLPYIAADSLKIFAMGFRTVKRQFDPSITYYEFELKYQDFYRYFINELWIWQNQQLYNPTIENKQLSWIKESD